MFRVGSGHDSHRLEEGRPLILGGVTLSHLRGLVGHSDADVVLHAVTDALLGALAVGDIGDLFPDNDPKWQNANSRLFLEESKRIVDEQGWQIGNLDVTIFAEEPKLGPVKALMQFNLAEFLSIDTDRINVKAKTGEQVGHIGRAEAIACHAVVLLHRPREEKR